MGKKFNATFLLGTLLVIACLLISTTQAFSQAQAGGEVSSEKDKPKTLKPGVVASFGNVGKVAAVDANSAGPGDDISPVLGSVSYNNGECIATLSNSSEASYSVSFAVVGTGVNGRQSFRRTYVATVGPKKSITRSGSCKATDNVSVQITSGKKIGG